MAVMIISTITLLESVTIVYLHHKAGRPPKWLRTFTFVYLARVFCMRDDVPNVDENEVKEVGTCVLMYQ